MSYTACTPCSVFPPPLEICEHILEHLGDDLSTLRACALVHSSWASASQGLLFRIVEVPPSRMRTPAEAFVDGYPWTHPISLWPRLLALVTQVPRLGALVRELDVWAPCAWWAALYIDRVLLPRVHTVRWHNLAPEPVFIATLPALQTVEFWGNARLGSDAWVEAIRPEEDGEGGEDRAHRSGTPCRPSRFDRPLCLHEVSIRDSWASHSSMLLWLARTGSADTLRTIHLDCTSSADLQRVVRLCGQLQVLEDLGLSIFTSRDCFKSESRHFVTSRRTFDPVRADLNLGTLGISTLRLSLNANANAVPIFLDILEDSELPEIKNLMLTFASTEAVWEKGRFVSTGGAAEFAPYRRASDELKARKIPSSLAPRLDRVVLYMLDVRYVHHGPTLLGHFSVCRPGIVVCDGCEIAKDVCT
jgi:hypothetical protein